MDNTEIQKVMKGKAIFGKDRVLKGVKLGEIKKVYLASNCPDHIKKDIMHYAKIGGMEIVELKTPANELGLLAKKLYSINVMGI